jgi:hypothetical protein
MKSPSLFLPGDPMTLKAFKTWIAEAEKATTINLEDAKLFWTKKKIQLRQKDYTA